MTKHPHIAALIVAAGSGERAGGDVPKQYRAIAGAPILRYSAEALLAHPAIAEVLVVISPEHRVYYEKSTTGLASKKLLPPVDGGEVRQASVRAGLKALAAHKPDYVLIHDAARPFLSHAVINRLLAALTPQAAVVPALAAPDTMRRFTEGGWKLIRREGLMRMQTPQAFPYGQLAALHDAQPGAATDDAALWLEAGLKLLYVEGEERLRKVTTAEDIELAECVARANFRTAVGMGYDVHKLIAGKSVRLGGLDIPHDKKLEGHSDADVVLHAVTDAILGALGQGDIGAHFPPTDAKLKGADSKIFIEDALKKLTARHGAIDHIDVTIICEAPKISPHREPMRQQLATLLKLDLAQVSVKATTTEKLGALGRGEGIAAQAVATLTLPRAHG